MKKNGINTEYASKFSTLNNSLAYIAINVVITAKGMLYEVIDRIAAIRPSFLKVLKPFISFFYFRKFHIFR